MYVKKYKENILDLLNGNGVNVDHLNISHIGLGDGTQPANENDVKLQFERFRKVIISKSRTGDAIESLIVLEENEANDFIINEIGVFADGDDLVNTGVLIARIVLSTSLPKNSANRITILRHDLVKINEEV